MRTSPYRPLESLRPTKDRGEQLLQLGVVVDPIIGTNRLRVQLSGAPGTLLVYSTAGLDANTGDRVVLARLVALNAWVALSNIDTADSAYSVSAASQGDQWGQPTDEDMLLVSGDSPLYIPTWQRVIPDARVRGELRAAHTAMGQSHGLGGTTHLAPTASLREEFEVP